MNKLYATDNSADALTNSITRQRLTGFAANTIAETISIDSLGNQTLSTTVLDRNNKKVTQTTDVPDSSSNIITVAVNGLPMSQISATGLKTTYAYDPLGRQNSALQGGPGALQGGPGAPRTVGSFTHYDSHGWVDYIADAAGNRTTFTYDSATGRKISQTDPLGNSSYFSYSSYGQLEKTWGSASYPVSYEYDPYGRMTKMNTYRSGTGWSGSTWPANPGAADTTEWIYHEASGLLTAKKDAAGKSVSYTYSSGGKLATRTWARKVDADLRTAYSYNSAGDLSTIDYSDTTPDVSFTYDRLGRQKTITDVLGTRTFAYYGLNLASETIPGGAGAPSTLTRQYDSLGRSSGFNLNSDYQVAYGYDPLGRFASASSASLAVNYSYLPNSDLVQSTTLSNDGVDLTTTRSYESTRNLLTQIKNEVNSSILSQFDYANDNAGRRTSIKHSGSAFETGPAFNLYDYNSRSEVIVGDKFWGANLNDMSDPVLGQGFAYAYDNIGNRTASSRDSEEMTYTANNLNQYSQRTVADLIDVIGSAETNTTVTVNDLPTSRHEKYWHRGLDVTNDTSAVWQPVSVVGVYNPPGTNEPDIVSSVAGHVFVPKTPEMFTYDDDGNMLSDGRFNYTWDCENRLISVETDVNKVGTAVPALRLEFSYDYMSRRIGKIVSKLVSGQWAVVRSHAFLYDGWNLIREISAGAPEETHSIEGQLNINPNNSPQNEFKLTLPDGSTITRDDLIQSYGGYSGPAVSIHLKPKGSGKQDGLVLDGQAYELDNSKAYDIAAGSMTVNLYNDRVDKKGRAMGHWWISIAASEATITLDSHSDTSSLNYTNTYIWGLDLSGTLQGAGGIGGLLASVRGGAGSPNTLLYTFDANGNVSELLNPKSAIQNPQFIAAHYEYSPFGETIVATGPEAQDNPFRFSTKYFDDESGLYYYGYRYYSPSLGRWLSRDPIVEKAFELIYEVGVTTVGLVNIYNFVNNNAINNNDLLSLCTVGETDKVYENVRHVGGEYTGEGGYYCEVIGSTVGVLIWRCRCYCERKNFEVRADVVTRICKEVTIYSFDECGNITTSNSTAFVDSGQREYNVLVRSASSGQTELWHRDYNQIGPNPSFPMVVDGFTCRSACRSRQGRAQ